MEERTLLRRMTAVLITLAAIAAILLVMMGAVNAAEVGPKIVQGYITDSVGSPIVGNVTVTISETTLFTTSNSTGFYRVTFGPSAWTIGDEIEVVVTVQGTQLLGSGVCTANPIDTVNVQKPYEIPEFGSPWGFVVVIAFILALGLWLIIPKRRLFGRRRL